MRFDDFHKTHLKIEEIVNSLAEKFPIRLPPFPYKSLKLMQDHYDPEFIASRRMLLQNYLQRLVKHRDLK